MIRNAVTPASFRNHPFGAALIGLSGLRTHPPEGEDIALVGSCACGLLRAVARIGLNETKLMIATPRDAGHDDIARRAQIPQRFLEGAKSVGPALPLQMACQRIVGRLAAPFFLGFL
ncbi:hypothetical protein [Variovorax beijingensis]|uniref:hypothetical protein n=1 Tax=Variovorax beijingensis TaxID=2496117 RepID=UPI000F60BBF5|nr:hypothetical protein [Variovorax beijingensis]